MKQDLLDAVTLAILSAPEPGEIRLELPNAILRGLGPVPEPPQVLELSNAVLKLYGYTGRELMGELMAADLAYGCGFYNDERWQRAYNEMAFRSGMTDRYLR